MITWSTCYGSEKMPEPVEGIDPNYDSSKKYCLEIHQQLSSYLTKVKTQFDRSGTNDIKYVHAKEKYELEVPEELVKGSKKPKEWELTSNKAGYQ